MIPNLMNRWKVLWSDWSQGTQFSDQPVPSG